MFAPLCYNFAPTQRGANILQGGANNIFARFARCLKYFAPLAKPIVRPWMLPSHLILFQMNKKITIRTNFIPDDPKNVTIRTNFIPDEQNNFTIRTKRCRIKTWASNFLVRMNKKCYHPN